MQQRKGPEKRELRSVEETCIMTGFGTRTGKGGYIEPFGE